MSIVNKLFYSLCLAMLAACGGGGGGESAITPAPVQQTTAAPAQSPASAPQVEKFKDEIVFPSAAGYIPEQCTRGGERHFSIPVNINDDNLTDFVAQYWCVNQSGEGAVHNVLVAFISNEYGYSIDNLLVFGEEFPALSGSIGGYDTGDFNLDGKLDIAVTVINEDGRSTLGEQGMENNSGLPTVFLSNDTGFDIISMGEPDWGGPVLIRDDVVHFAGTRSCTVGEMKCHQTFRYQSGEFVNVTAEYGPLNNYGFDYIDDNTIVSSDYWFDQDLGAAQFGLLVWEKLETEWVVTDVLPYGELSEFNYMSWNEQSSGTEQYQTQMLLRMGDDNVVAAHTNQVNVVTVDGERRVVVKFGGEYDRYKEIYPGDYVKEGAQGLPLYSKIKVYDLQGGLAESDVTITDQYVSFNSHKMQVVDVNGDGVDDLVVNAFTSSQTEPDQPELDGLMQVYLNVPGEARYQVMDMSELEIYNRNVGSHTTTSFVGDFNGDGLQDVLAIAVDSNDHNTIGDQLYIAGTQMFGEDY